MKKVEEKPEQEVSGRGDEYGKVTDSEYHFFICQAIATGYSIARIVKELKTEHKFEVSYQLIWRDYWTPYWRKDYPKTTKQKRNVALIKSFFDEMKTNLMSEPLANKRARLRVLTQAIEKNMEEGKTASVAQLVSEIRKEIEGDKGPEVNFFLNEEQRKEKLDRIRNRGIGVHGQSPN